ncbi:MULTISPECIES: Dps family protein [Mesoflavibacter]|uniref:DNA starvation/stationary phase protection protein n=1 Tax=Mesoflavibacter profundi TaxID=2708110 RepID=A0ABT4RYB4_9FLAO|nr:MULTISPECIES: DNA starvation/stationary phase protection protein [Mesoflavibacter]MDA0176623.1 DNA starvation/stationary phase protection protein [Mesoflavibacter profundi]QIJ90280.1 DNA protection during starvation protein [Mesoflavibacter sp. HG96]QIJ93008.1 DNA protection during starvation protein [Mesoflavibacter sp. HG37]
MSYLNMQDEKLLPVVMDLNTLLSDYHMYYQKLRSFHWNVLGKNFFDLHEQFENMYNDAKIKIDEIAERILTLRHHPVSKFSDYIKIATVQEESAMISDQAMINSLLKDHKIILAQMSNVIESAEKANDEGTIDLIGAYIRELEKTSWMLNAWSKKTSEQLKQDKVIS